jgi:aconitase A
MNVNNKNYKIFDINAIAQKNGVDISNMPFSIKILLENVARTSTEADVIKVLNWLKHKGKDGEDVQYLPYRVLMQDFTGVPAIVDLAAMRDAVAKLGGDVSKINPIAPVHLVIDHSVQVDFFGSKDASQKNTNLEMERNRERYEFLKWGQKAFNNFKIVPPGTGICHQINIEHIAPVIAEKDGVLFFDTLVGTDSHTTMVNGLGVLGWGVGGIEAESVMLGQPIALLVPEVIGFKLTGNIKEGVTATDLILTITQMLRKKGVVGKFVEFYGSGLANLTLEDRATIANMAPEYGATCGIFPIDEKTIEYLNLTGRSQEQLKIVEEYAKAQGVFGSNKEYTFTDTLELDLSTVVPCLAGPKRPQDKIALPLVSQNFLDVSLVDKKGIVLRTDEFYIRHFTLEDAENLHKIHTDEAVTNIVGTISHDGTQEWLKHLVLHQNKYGYSQWAIFSNQTNEIIGKGGILNIGEDGRLPPHNGTKYQGNYEISLFLMQEYEHMTDKVLSSILDWSFSNIDKNECFAFVRKNEDNKIKALQKQGFVKTDEFEKVFEFTVKESNENRIKEGSVAIAAITSCTNTSNPSVLIAAGLLAKKAVEKGLKVPAFVKTSLAPGSRVAEEYLAKSGLQEYLDKLGFNIVGFGCTTCIGNSGPLKPEIEQEITTKNLTVSAVLSGNRNFEGRVHQFVKANYLASPPLVVAYALLGTVKTDITTQSIGFDTDGKPVFLKDIWPTNAEIQTVLQQFVTRDLFIKKYANVYDGTPEWQEIPVVESKTYKWVSGSTYIENPPYFEGMQQQSSGIINDIISAKPLLILGDSITTDHISPAGNISKNSPAAEFLQSNGIKKEDFNSYGARRGSHSVMMRGTFANTRIKNEILQGAIEGGYTKDLHGKTVSVYEAAMGNKKAKIPSIVIAGKEYGTGSSRDWAAKGTYLLGVRAVIAESFERIHRSNLVGMGVLPFEFTNSETRTSLNIKGDELITIANIKDVKPMSEVNAEIKYADGSTQTIKLRARIDTNAELEYIKNGGIMQYVIRNTVFKNNTESKQSCCPMTSFFSGIAKLFKRISKSCENKSCKNSACKK